MVKKCIHKPTNTIMAIKYLNIPQSRVQDNDFLIRLKAIRREIDNLYMLRSCPTIVDFYGLCMYEGQALLCMQLMDLSLKELYILIHSGKGKDENFPEELVICVFVKIVDALLFCKDKGIIHRDIKPNNILVNYR